MILRDKFPKKFNKDIQNIFKNILKKLKITQIILNFKMSIRYNRWQQEPDNNWRYWDVKLRNPKIITWVGRFLTCLLRVIVGLWSYWWGCHYKRGFKGYKLWFIHRDRQLICHQQWRPFPDQHIFYNGYFLSEIKKI